MWVVSATSVPHTILQRERERERERENETQMQRRGPNARGREGEGRARHPAAGGAKTYYGRCEVSVGGANSNLSSVFYFASQIHHLGAALESIPANFPIVHLHLVPNVTTHERRTTRERERERERSDRHSSKSTLALRARAHTHTHTGCSNLRVRCIWTAHVTELR